MSWREQWHPVTGFEHLYDVSNQGRVRSHDRTVIFRDGRTRTFHGRILKHGFSRGYPRVNLYDRNKKSFPREIHKLVALAFIGPRPEGQQVRHYDGDKCNCWLSNLLYGTASENYADKVRHGKDNPGEKHGMHRLTERIVINIRQSALTRTQAEIAREYRVDASLISRICSRELWRHL